MNPLITGPTTSPSNALSLHDREDDINLLALLDVVLEHRWVIVTAACFVLMLGFGYAFMATPIYEANTLIQVEDSKGDPMSSMLGEATSLFDIRSPTTAEVEILRSRLVVGQAVENLQLDLEVRPKYLPIIGRWLSRRSEKPSVPGFLGFPGYVIGNESLSVAYLNIPPSLEGTRFSVVLTADGYELRSQDDEMLGHGKLGKPLPFKSEGFAGELQVDSANGEAGAEFYLTHYSRLAVTESLQKSLDIAEQGRQSGIIQAALQGDDPQRAARVLNEIGRLYVRQNIERKAAEAEKSLAFLGTQLPQLRQQLETSEVKFNQFRRKTGTFDLDNEAQASLNSEVDLRVKLLEAQEKRKELETRFTAQHPVMQALDAQVRAIMAEIGSLESKTKELPNVEQDLLRLTRDVKVNNELYTNLLNSAQQLRLVKEGKVGNVRIVDAAVIPLTPVKPKRSMVVALSGVLGLLVGLGLAVIRNSFRPVIRDASEIESQSGLNVFATVPQSDAQLALAAKITERRPGYHLLAHHNPDDPAVESLRSLRTALQFGMLDASNNIVVVTGPTPGVGKSFTSANFSAVLAAGGKRVLLIDADLRKGHIHKYFDMERGKGLSDLIAEGLAPEDVIRKSVAPQLDLITAGTSAPNPAELLMSPTTGKLLSIFSSRYDVVIIDTAPVLVVADTQVLAPHAGTVFMIARADISTMGEVQETAKRLAHSGIAVRGVVFNGLNISKRRYGYGGYRYAQYGY